MALWEHTVIGLEALLPEILGLADRILLASRSCARVAPMLRQSDRFPACTPLWAAKM